MRYKKSEGYVLSGLLVVLVDGFWLYTHCAKLFPENERTTPGMIKLLAAGAVFIAGMIVILIGCVQKTEGR